ncbi:hypothetical protein [Acetobacter oryzifermentans]|uniref:Nif11 domain-containing protein n=1 Tax=Acetobacter oryzifermentans TaxID=1633874 RepID=A0ABN4NQN6_9PROT|nr:hypothetical protein [Acetobacter oryzifermentans]ANA14193.1 hypothetical protein WG31_09420 [Acetobacter oryzifermentans]
MMTNKEKALFDLDRTYAEFKKLIQSAPENARFSVAAVATEIEDGGYRPTISIFGDTPGDIVLAAATVFGFSSGLSTQFKNPEDFVEIVNSGIQCGTGEFSNRKVDAPCSATKH